MTRCAATGACPSVAANGNAPPAGNRRSRSPESRARETRAWALAHRRGAHATATPLWPPAFPDE